MTRARTPPRRKRGEAADAAGIPSATYRVQLNRNFRFRDAKDIVAYLDRLGVSHFYSSPLLMAKSGSLHCYDVVRHDELNPEIGTREEFDSFSRELGRKNMGLVVDIVPNHMSAGDENPLWMNVLEYGPSAEHADYFDIRWSQEGKVVLPILADELSKVLGTDALEVQYAPETASFSLLVGRGTRVPLTPRSYAGILQLAIDADILPLSKEAIDELRGLVAAFGAIGSPRSPADVDELKGRLRSIYGRDPDVLASIGAALHKLNGEGGAPALEAILDHQFYRLTYWRDATKKINYRRFLNLNDYVAIRTEEMPVFHESHDLLIDLVSKGVVAGLRVDHPDGLADPTQYFGRLVRLATTTPSNGSAARNGKGRAYIVAEKILRTDEQLPKDWRIQGTTGYDFLNLVNGLFVLEESREEFDSIYWRFTGKKSRFEDVSHAAKKRFVETSMLADLRFLARALAETYKDIAPYSGVSLSALEKAITEVACSFPVYRTYVSPARTRLARSEISQVEAAIAKAGSTDGIDGRALDMIRDALTEPRAGRRDSALEFAMRFQLFTPPVMVKGVEDTAFYRYNRLASLNEVGGEPGEFGIPTARFHSENARRAKGWPHSMLATSTHDTKRSEDVRARINVLSEMPVEWRSALSRWSALNTGKKSIIDAQRAPSRDDEYILYQALLGAWPFDKYELPAFTDRMVAYMSKASKEAKQNTSWEYPRKAYDAALERFVRSVLEEGNAFLDDFLPFQAKVANFGVLNSLSQLLLKLTSPGVPDIYQGTEVWDYSLVDPDNRRPVDFKMRAEMLDDLTQEAETAEQKKGGLADLASELMRHPEDGRVKMYVLNRTLAYRRRHLGLFTDGLYAPVKSLGPKKDHVVAFSRAGRDDRALVVVPRFFSVLGAGTWPLQDPERVWGGTKLLIGEGLPSSYTELFTGEHVETVVKGKDRWLDLASVLSGFPVALLDGSK